MRAWKLTIDTSSIGELIIFMFKSRRIFASHYKIWCILRSANIPWTSEMTTWSPKKFNNFVIIKNNTVLLGSFTWLRISNICMKFSLKIPSSCWEKGKNFRGYFFCRALYITGLGTGVGAPSRVQGHSSCGAQRGKAPWSWKLFIHFHIKEAQKDKDLNETI